MAITELQRIVDRLAEATLAGDVFLLAASGDIGTAEEQDDVGRNSVAHPLSQADLVQRNEWVNMPTDARLVRRFPFLRNPCSSDSMGLAT